ncbi:MAG: large repetitive protein [Chloroflexota bacterium]|nr:large repetitive protein [Chloroflexota bacterium]
MNKGISRNRQILTVLVLFSMAAASLLSSGVAWADDGTPVVEPQGAESTTSTYTPTATLTPTATNTGAAAQPADTQPPAQDGAPPEPSQTPSPQFTDTPTLDPAFSATPALTDIETPELFMAESLLETPTPTPTQTEEPELVVPLLMPADESNIIPDQYIVVYRNDVVSSQGLKSQRDKVKQKGGKIKAEFSHGIKGFSAKMDKETLKALRQDPDIAYIEPDQYIFPADDSVGAQSVWPLEGSGTWGLDRIDQAALARDYQYHYPTSAGTGVHVYVVDSGVNGGHPEFGGRVGAGYDFVDNDSDPSDVLGHGTAVAGVIGSTNYGVAKLVSLHSVRVLDANGDGSFTNVVAGINWVIENHINPAVINMSLGVKSTSKTLNTAVANAVAAGITVVVAAGNTESGGVDACTWTPASELSAITVGATTNLDYRASYSNLGSCLDIFAPGSNITTTTMDGGYGNFYGTSIASPMVAGAAALYLADHPGASPSQVVAALTSQATSDVLYDIGGGSPNLLLAVSSNEVDQVALAAPADGSATNQTDVALSWTAGYNNDSYTLEVDDSSAFDSLFYTTSTQNLSETVSGLGEGTWYWRVQAANAYGTTGAWSETWSFAVDLTAPAIPAQSSPANGANVVGTPEFTWSAVADAAAYQFEYHDSDDPNTQTPLYISEELTGTAFTPPDMSEEVTYYWYVRARDAAGNWSDWSTASTVMIVPPGPAAPALTSPQNGSASNALTYDLTWQAVVGADSYHLQLSTDDTFTTTSVDVEGLTELSYTTGELAEGTYYWRLQTRSSYGIYGNWSTAYTFTVDRTAPDVPVLAGPITGTKTIGMPVFYWNAVPDAAAYQFEYGTDENNAADYVYRSEELANISYQPPSKNTDVTYYWFVRTRDAVGNWSEWSAPFFITVQANNPVRASLSEPRSKTLTNDDMPEFSWQMLENSAYYHIQIADSKYFTNIVQEADGLTELSYVAEALPADGVYFWRVRGRNGTDAYGVWSSYRYFTLDTTAPDKPTLLSPADTVTYAGQPTYKWSRPSGAKYYRFKYTSVADPNTELYVSEELRSYSYKAPSVDKGIYYWYAQARDVAGNWSDWSDPFTVYIVPPKPARVTISAPRRGALTTDDQPTLEWNTAAYADTYDIQVSTSSRFSSLIADVSGWADLTYTLDVLSDARYYWRVRAVNTEGVQGSWSSTFYFTVDTLPPDAPTLYRPLDNTDSNGTPTFIWTRPSTSKYYQFKYAAAAAPGTDLYVSEEMRTYKFKPPTMDLGSYVWSARARDVAGNWGEWSSPYTIEIVPPVPARANLSEPLRAQYVDNDLPTLSWAAVDYADSYDLQLSTSSKFTTLVVDESGLTELNYIITDTLPDARYYWRVRAVNTGGIGSWSRVYYFVVDTLAPNVPLLRSPLDASELTGTPTFKWYRASGARYYQLAYNTVNDPSTAIYTSPWTAQTAMKINFMDFLTDYYWFVRSQDTAGNISEWSQGRKIFLNPPKPYRVVTTSPAKGELIDDNTPTLSWNAATYAYTYEYQIDDSSRFRSVNYEGVSEVETTSVTTEELAIGKWYYRVRAVNEVGVPGSWSAVRYFTFYTKVDTGFNSDGDFEGWMANTGAGWSVSSGSLNSGGLPGGYTTSASYSDVTFNDFTYQATMRMDAPASGETNTYGLVLRGTPAFDTWFDWTDGIYFTVRQINDNLTSTQYTCALVYRIASGKWTYLGGSCGQAGYANWNTLKVYARSRTLKFYINDALILSTSQRGPYSGKLGVVSWGESVSSVYVDAAAVGAPVEPLSVTSLSAQSMTLPPGVNPEDVFNKMKK